MSLALVPDPMRISAPAHAPRAERPSRSFNQTLASLAASQPDHPAVLSVAQVFTYSELLGRIGALAEAIRAAAAPPGPLALLLPNGLDYVAATFAAISAGRPVLILEPTQPPARLAALLDMAGTGLVLHDGSRAMAAVVAGRPALVPVAAPVPRGLPAESLTRDDAAFLFTTSGSSGLPKLVAHSQDSLMFLLLDIAARSSITPADRLARELRIAAQCPRLSHGGCNHLPAGFAQ